MKYTTDGKYSVKAGKIEIARSYVNNDTKSSTSYEVRILQGMNRTATIEKICIDCPDFATANGINKNYYPYLFSK